MRPHGKTPGTAEPALGQKEAWATRGQWEGALLRRWPLMLMLMLEGRRLDGVLLPLSHWPESARRGAKSIGNLITTGRASSELARYRGAG